MNLLSWYSIKLPIYLVYMLQQVNYRAPKFIIWLMRNPKLNKVMHRKILVYTKAAKLLVFFTTAWLIVSVVAGLNTILTSDSTTLKILGVLLLLCSPFITGIILTIFIYTAYIIVTIPRERRLIAYSTKVFKDHPAIKIGVAGSYGKTTAKEVIGAILSEKFNVAVTPGNMNTPIAHARFAKKLNGNEDVLIIEYGEEYPGDIKRFINTTHPDYAVLMGLAPNHLDYYKTIDCLATDLLELRTLGDNLYINGESQLLKKYLNASDNVVTSRQAGDWLINNITIKTSGTSFIMSNNKHKISLKSGLIGRHHVAPLAIAVLLATKLGLNNHQIEEGLTKTVPYEHRMQPHQIGGATILDDTYNGNLEGMIAGLSLLKELIAKRKIYVTPGLVDQGKETQAVHTKIAKKLYDVAPDLIVLMDNSATRIIKDTLDQLQYKGSVKIETDPLNYYSNIEKTVAAGDLVMMQNDWTDNYF